MMIIIMEDPIQCADDIRKESSCDVKRSVKQVLNTCICCYKQNAEISYVTERSTNRTTNKY